MLLRILLRNISNIIEENANILGKFLNTSFSSSKKSSVKKMQPINLFHKRARKVRNRIIDKLVFNGYIKNLRALYKSSFPELLERTQPSIVGLGIT